MRSIAGLRRLEKSRRRRRSRKGLLRKQRESRLRKRSRRSRERNSRSRKWKRSEESGSTRKSRRGWMNRERLKLNKNLIPQSCASAIMLRIKSWISSVGLINNSKTPNLHLTNHLRQ